MNLRDLRPILLLLLLLISSEAFAQTLDQEYLPYTSLVAQARDIDYWGQSFTVGTTGLLDSVAIAVKKEIGVTADMDFILFRINNSIANVSSGIALTIPNAQLPTGGGYIGGIITPAEMLSIDLSSYNFNVTAGDEVGMLVHSTIGFNERPMINWFGGCNNNTVEQCGFNNSTSDGYLFGSPLQVNQLSDFTVSPRTDFDFGFRTFVSSTPVVPEPISSTLFIVGGATLGFRQFRKRFKK